MTQITHQVSLSNSKKSRTLPQVYTVQHKEQMKEKFLETLSIHKKNLKRDFTIGININDIQESLESWIKQELVPALDSAGIQTFVLGENIFKSKFKHVTFIPQKREKEVWEACDLFIWPSEDEQSKLMHFGTVCISKNTSTLLNYDPLHETGNGFVSPVKNTWSLFAEIIRAQVNYSFPYDWKQICQSAMDWSFRN